MRVGVDTGWRLASLALAWLAGVAAHLQQRSLWPVAVCIAAVVLGALGVAVGWRLRRAFVLALIGAALLGAAVSGWRASVRLADALPAALEGRDLVVSGVVASLPQRGVDGIQFRFQTEAATLHGEPVRIPTLLRLGWYRHDFGSEAGGGNDTEAPPRSLPDVRAGERWRYTLRLRQPHGILNPHGPDHELRLFEQGVRATGSVRDAPAPERLQADAGQPVQRLRQRLRDAIEARVPDRRTAGVIAALAVGDQGAITRDDWDVYRNTGVAHLVAISGLHITMFAWLASRLVGALWRRSAALMLLWPAPSAARWGALAFAASYALLAGWGVPAQRTVWMLAVVTAMQALGLRWPWALVLLLAAVVVTAFDPWALLQAGFWLSFAAVGLLMASSPAPDAGASVAPGALRRVWNALRSGVRTQVIATLGLAPLTLVFFQQVSVIGFVANLIAIPLVTLLITPLALLGAAVAPAWGVAAWCVQRLNAVLGGLAALPGAVWTAPVAPPWAQLAGLVAAALLVLPLPWRLRALALPLLVPLLLPARALPPPGAFDLLALDVGQGTAVLVRTRGHLLVFDSGPRYSRDSDAGARVLLPLLRAHGDVRIDTLVLSHRDLDHVGGAAALLQALPVGELLSSLETGHPLLAAAPQATRCIAGRSWEWDGVRFEVLRPQAGDYGNGLKPNAMSCVVRVEGGGRSALLTGDIERRQEAALVAAAAPAGLRSDVLIVAHHGSRTSSTAAFIDAVRPGVAMIQAGHRNRFGHPAADVLERYRTRGIDVRVSPQCGAWRWDAGAPIGGVCERDARRRYWHHAVQAGD